MLHYLWLVYLTGFYILTTSSQQINVPSGECFSYNPLYINGTQNSSELRCPYRCNCQYCPLNKHMEASLEYSHNVYCTNLKFTYIPPKNTVPTDVFYYYLGNNNIFFLKNYSFSTSTNLEYLHFNDNELKYSSIEHNAFRGLTNLKYIALDGNKQLSQLRRQWFIDLISLEIIYASRCSLTTIDIDAFKNCKNLTKLHLSLNDLTILPSTLFQNFKLLESIFISNNKLKHLSNNAFKGSNNLLEIIFHDNLLSSISENVGIQNLTKLHLIHIAYNAFSCDCDMVWFRNWINTTNVTIEDIDNTKCYTNKHTKQYHKLLDFDPDQLDCSKFRKILKMVILSATPVVVIVMTMSILYKYRYDIKYWNQKRRLRKQYQKLENIGPPPINGEDIRYDAFVSYNSKDQDWVLKILQPSLEENRNYKLCVDYRDFVVGDAIADNIANAVKYSRKVLLIVSKNFAKSEWCYFELEMARMRMFENHEDILVVVLLEKVSSREMPILLHKILTKKTYIEWDENPEGQGLFWAKLEEAMLSPNCHRERLLDPLI